MAGYFLYSIDSDKFRRLVEEPTPSEIQTLCQMLAERFDELPDVCNPNDPVLQWNRSPESLEAIIRQRFSSHDWYGDLSTAGKELWEGLIFDICNDDNGFDVGFKLESEGIYWDVINVAFAKLRIAPATINEKALSTFGQRPYRYCPPPPGFDAPSIYDPEIHGSSVEQLQQFIEEAQQHFAAAEQEFNEMLAGLALHEGTATPQKRSTANLLNLVDEDEDADEETFEAAEWPWQPMHSMHSNEEVKQMLEELISIEPVLLKSPLKGVRHDYEEELLPALEEISKSGRMLFVQVDY